MKEKREKSFGAAKRKLYETRVFRLVWPLLILALLMVGQVPVAAGQQPINGLDPNLQEPAQDNMGPTRDMRGNRDLGPNRDLGRMDPTLAKRQVEMLNVQRQKMMVSDTAKLLKLATELKAEIDAGDSVSLTPEQLRKISEIEKLAHSVKQKMSITVGVGPQLHDAFFP